MVALFCCLSKRSRRGGYRANQKVAHTRRTEIGTRGACVFVSTCRRANNFFLLQSCWGWCCVHPVLILSLSLVLYGCCVSAVCKMIFSDCGIASLMFFILFPCFDPC